MPLAYFLLAHKNPRQVARLFREIYREEDVFVLHIDRRSDAAMHRLSHELAAQFSNVIVLHPQAIVWGGFAAAAVQLESMSAALAANKNWHHFINISGQDFPLKPISELENYLAANPEANYIPWFDPLAEPLWRNARKRLERFYFAQNWLERFLKIPGFGRRLRKALGWHNQLTHVPLLRRKMPDFHYYGGSNYVVLSRAAAEYTVSSPEGKRISKWLRHSVHPDEIFIQSILLNSPLAPTVQNMNLHEIDFPRDSPHPKTYAPADLDRLLASPKFFARKFDSARDPELVETISSHLRTALPSA